MVGAADVVAGDDGDERGGAVRACGLQAAEGVGCDGALAAVAVALGCYTGVYTLVELAIGQWNRLSVTHSGIASPKLNIGVRHRLAAGRIHDVDIKVSDCSLLARQNVLADQLADNPFACC
jgi:hypothetical protein